MDYDDLDTYNGDIIHDMYVDSDFEINTSELPVIGLPLAQQELFDEADLDDFIDNLNDWD